MIVTKKNESRKNIFSQLWNEFLFAREFEYESPLTPDEISAALRAIEKVEQKSWMLSAAKLTHKLEIQRHGDKAADFKIMLEEDKNSAWSSRMNLLYSEGTITADPVEGLSIIKGRTRFSGQYYLIWFAVFSLNILTGGMSPFAWFWLFAALIFGVAMYNERNKLADSLDMIIMHAKSERSLAILDGEEDLDEAETVVESQRLSESE
jgi:hypothetical protein